MDLNYLRALGIEVAIGEVRLIPAKERLVSEQRLNPVDNMFAVQDANHLLFLNGEHGSGCARGGRPHTDLLTCQASFAEKVSRSQHGTTASLPTSLTTGQLHSAYLNVHYMIRGIALCEDGRVSLKLHNLSGYTGCIQK